MKNYQKGFALSLIIIIVALLLAAGGAYVYEKNKQANQNQPLTASSTPQTTSTTQTTIAFPPNGWYVHNSSDISMVLTKQKTYPAGYCDGTEGACFGEQIDIAISTTTLTPEQYIANITVFPSTQKWGILNGHKTFSMTYTTEVSDVPTDGQYLFIGNKVYDISLYPSAEKNRNDFQQVINYYATKSQ